MADEEQYPVLRAGLAKVAKEPVFMYHVQFSSDFLKTLAAPASEFAIWTLKESTDRAQFQQAVAKFTDQLLQEVPSSDVLDSGWGAVAEDKRKFIGGFGWHSIEVSLHVCQPAVHSSCVVHSAAKLRLLLCLSWLPRLAR